MENKDLVQIKNEINQKLGDAETLNVLLATTFKGLQPTTAKRAILEGMIRGYEFKDFLEKNVYAIPFKEGYSLVTSIEYARKVGMRSGVVGKTAPVFVMDGDKIESCTITIKRKVDGYVGEYSATAFFSEYYKGGYGGRPSLWDTKPRTMIAKVAEMHALRMACPEELSQTYVEEERQADTVTVASVDVTDIPDQLRVKVKEAKTEAELKTIWLENKGKGKDFAKLVTEQRDFIRSVTKQEVEETNA